MDTSESWLNPCLPSNTDSNPDMETQQTYVSLKPTCSTSVMKSPSTSVLNLGEQKVIKTLRPHSTPATLMWLEENYEIADGICIPRSTLYMHYVDFCDRNGMQPVNAASFGKIIRQQFPQLTTRRLGTRGQSRYHYYGIAVRETSAYYDVTFSKQGLNNTGEIKRETNRQVSPYSPKSKMVSLLPDFPSTKHLHLPSNTGEERVATFLMMYHTHCQRIMDTIIRASFDEVQSFLLHFWQGMPPHINSVLGTNVIVNIVGVCDSILYRAISNVLLPSVLQPVPDSLTQVIRKFSKDLESWIRIALEDLPENLVTVKYDLARRFSQMLRRQTSLNHLSQASRMVLHNVDITSQMLHDWRNVDQDSICRQTIYSMDQTYNSHTLQLIRTLYREFDVLLEEQSSMQAYIDWLETMVDRCVVQPSRKHKNSLRRISRQFLLMWSAFGTRVIRDMTLHSAPSFGSFHLLHLTFDDYVLYLVETLYADERMRELYANIATDSPPSFSDLEETFGDPDGNMNKVKWYNTPTSDPSEHLVTPNTTIVLGTNTPRPNTEITGPPPTPNSNPESTADSTNCVMTDATNDSGAGNPNLMTEFTSVNEHYATMYPPYGTSYDSRNGYRMTSRNYPYQTNQYILTPQNNGAADMPTREGSPRNSEIPINGIEYSNTYISYRRPEYGSYGYEQSTPTSTTVIYPPHGGNSSYYGSYETTGYGTRCKIKDPESNKELNIVENVDHEEKDNENDVVAMPSYNSANNYVRV